MSHIVSIHPGINTRPLVMTIGAVIVYLAYSSTVAKCMIAYAIYAAANNIFYMYRYKFVINNAGISQSAGVTGTLLKNSLLSDINNVIVRDNFISRALGYGDLIIKNNKSYDMRIKAVENPTKMRDYLLKMVKRSIENDKMDDKPEIKDIN